MKANFKKELYSWGKSLIFALILVMVCRHFIFLPIAVKGESMSPTLEDKNKVVISKLSSVNRFDIVVLQAPDRDEYYIKRVIGVPGDRVQVKDDILYINDKAYKETYVKKDHSNILTHKLTGDFELQDFTGEKTVPEGFYFILGDNRWKSRDSREYGFISAKSIIGEVKFQYYPLRDIGIPK